MAANPNPARISGEAWRFWEDFQKIEPSANEFSGVYASKPGYHNYRNALPVYDYSRILPADLKGPGDKASAVDLKMNDAAMRRQTARLRGACTARDPRLFIGGVPIIREFIGTLDSQSVYCFVLAGGGGLAYGEDDGRDDSHLWHIHLSITRQFLATWDAYARLLSIMSGESLAAWQKTTTSTGGQDAPGEEEVHMIPIQLPRGYAFDEKGGLLAREHAISVPVEPAGYAGNPIVGGRKFYLSFSSDFNDKPLPVRVAIWDGANWVVSTIFVKKGGRNDVAVPPAKGPTAYNVSLGRVRLTATADPAEALYPLSVLVTVA